MIVLRGEGKREISFPWEDQWNLSDLSNIKQRREKQKHISKGYRSYVFIMVWEREGLGLN